MSTQPIIVSLEELTRTGQLGPIALGMSRDEVSRAFGEPTDWAARRPVRRSPVWKYGDIEIHFRDERVSLIHADAFDKPIGGGGLHIDPWAIRRGLPLSALEQALRHSEIPFTCGPDRWNPGCVKVEAASGVTFVVQIEGDVDTPSLDERLGLQLFSVWTRQ